MKNAGKVAKKAPDVLMSTPVSEAEADRRLRPVLDALYNHNWKQALKLVQQAIHKRPGWPAARALRACALMHSERFAEATKEIEEVRADLDRGRVPLDEDCARKLHMYYLEMRKEECAAEVYEQAWKSDLANFQLAEVSFCLYIRGSTFSSARRIATKLHQFASKKTQKYGLWATAALWLEQEKARWECAGKDPFDARMLKLSCSMLSKALDSLTSTPSAEMVRFAVRVYKSGGELHRAHSLVSNPRLVMEEAEVLHIRTEVPLSDDGCLTDHIELLKQYDIDDWVHWMKYFEIIVSKPDWETRASEFIDSAVICEADSERPRRGPFLARLELMLRMKQLDSLARGVMEYFNRFGGKIVAANDLRPYVCALSGSEFFEGVLDGISEVAKTREDSHHLAASWLRVWFNRLDDCPENLFNRYKNLIMEKSDPTDRQPGDDYLILAALKLLPDSKLPVKDRYGDSAAVLKSVLIVEAGLLWSPFNFHLKLLLIRLYIQIGALGRVAELWTSMEVKHVQLATLNHIVLHPFFETGHHDSCRELLEGVESLWRECDQEIPECISKAFQGGSVNAAIDFVLFRNRLERSHSLAEAMVIEVLYELAAAGGEPIGVKRALNCISSMPRFTVEELTSSLTLLRNSDKECFRFWESQAYDADCRLEFKREVETEQGEHCSRADIAGVVADLHSLEVLLRMAAGNDISISQGDRDCASAKLIASAATGEDLPVHTVFRVRTAQSFAQIRKILQRSLKINSSVDNGGLETEKAAAVDVLATARRICQDVVERVRQLVAIAVDCQNGVGTTIGSSTSGNGIALDCSTLSASTFTPSRLRSCGRIVFDYLLVTSVALLSFSSLLMRGKRKAKKSVAKAEAQQSASVDDFKHAREAVLEYKQAILEASSHIESWITLCLEKDLEWASYVIPEGEDMSHLVPFLPDLLPRVDWKDGHVCGFDLDRSEFCDGILAHICSGHAKSCKNILETLRGVTNRLKMVDL